MSSLSFARAVVAASLALAFASPRVASAQPIHERDERVTKDSASHAEADDGASIGAEVDAWSRFVWRGIALGDGPVVQPSTWASLYGVTASVWANAMLRESSTHSRLSSLVSSVSYTFTSKHARLEPGFILYYSPTNDGPHSTGEASLEAALSAYGFELMTAQFLDVANNRGAYFGTLGASYERKLNSLTLKASVDIGWANAAFNHAYFEWSAAQINVAESALSIRYDLTESIYAGAHAEASTLLSDSLRQQVPERTLTRAGALVGFEL